MENYDYTGTDGKRGRDLAEAMIRSRHVEQILQQASPVVDNRIRKKRLSAQKIIESSETRKRFTPSDMEKLKEKIERNELKDKKKLEAIKKAKEKAFRESIHGRLQKAVNKKLNQRVTARRVLRHNRTTITLRSRIKPEPYRSLFFK